MHSYRTLHVWQKAHAAAGMVLRVTDRRYHPRSRALFDQLKRSAVSVEANIVEGYALRTPLQFRRHLRIALGSAAETECLLRLASEQGYFPEGDVKELQDLIDSTIGMLVGFLRRRTSER